MFQQKFNMNLQESGMIIAFPDIVFILMGGFLGYFVDKKGKRGYLLAFGFIMLFFSHLTFYGYKACPDTPVKDKCYEGIFPMTLVGMSNTIIQITLYPVINYIVKEKYFGTAYGILETACNLGMIIGSLLIGLILNIANGKEDQETDLLQYKQMHLTFIFIGLLGTLIAIALNIYDRSSAGMNVLNTIFDRKARENN